MGLIKGILQGVGLALGIVLGLYALSFIDVAGLSNYLEQITERIGSFIVEIGKNK